jgi:transposase
MEVVNERCCGLDVHKQTVVACVITPGGRLPHKEVRTFGTMTADLLELSDWLAECQVTHVAMESTGVYWKPIWNLLEDQVELLLVNAHHVKQVPGRKTDVKDCEWLADLLRHGLLRASFVPDRPQRELRELTRYRTSLIRERSAEINRVQKTLEGACATTSRRRYRGRRSNRTEAGCIRDGGWPSGVALQGEIPNHLPMAMSK